MRLPTNAVRAAACVALLWSTSCTAMLDPHRFEQVRYGMAHDEVEQVLEVAVRDRLRVLPEQPGDPEWLLDGYWSEHPHPVYVVAYRDGELASVLHQGDLPDDLRFVGAPMGHQRITRLVATFAATRHPLAWAELEPIDATARRDGLDPTTHTVLLLVVFPPALVGLAMLPVVWLTMPLFEGDVSELRMQLSARALSLPAGCTRERAAATLGEPRERRPVDGEPDVELWDYWVEDNLSSDFSCRLGFVGDRLRWVQASRPGATVRSSRP
ncbi:MAG: hypothetical protein ACE37K_20545 [Planctomycetota bacterium]